MERAALPERLYGHIQVDDAVVEIIEVLEEQPWGASFCPPHTHVWFEFNYIYEGCMRTGFGGPLLDVGAGQFFVVPPGLEHCHEYEPQSPHRGVCLRWTFASAELSEDGEPGGVRAMLESLRHWRPGCYEDRYGLGERIARLFGEARASVPPASVRLTFVQILLALAAIRDPAGTVAPPAVDLSDAAFLRKIEIYLNDDRAERVDVRRLAASMHVSYNHLARKYKRLTGKTIVGRHTEVRLARALKLLEETGASMANIADIAGFGAAHYFSRVFKEAYGVSPKAYRSAHAYAEADESAGAGLVRESDA
ncbi:AraC family transcriptional regulator [Cohnella sp. GbtcB17]|uniref:AraC family transcriptional regulator n=1 Tax=Cohnella sp. GbtcB17 TaxID=2824762 RepID=UPI001C2FE293